MRKARENENNNKNKKGEEEEEINVQETTSTITTKKKKKGKRIDIITIQSSHRLVRIRNRVVKSTGKTQKRKQKKEKEQQSSSRQRITDIVYLCVRDRENRKIAGGGNINKQRQSNSNT
jgi:hypothetical protein